MPVSSTKLTIGFDGRGVRPEPDGIGHASLRLLESLNKIGQQCRFVVWHLPEAARCFPQNERIRLVPCPHHHLSYFTLNKMGTWIDRAQVDVFHAPFFFAPLKCKTPHVVTVYDLMALDDKDFFDGMLWRAKRWFHRRYVPKVIRRADRVICTSKIVGERIQEIFQENIRIHVIPLGLDAAEWTHAPSPELRREFETLGVSNRYFLHVGRWRPYKDLPTLFAAYRTYLDKTQRQPAGLVCCRGGGGNSEERFLDAYNLRDKVLVLDAPNDEMVIALMQKATALLQPSRYEGFGLPALEAMAAGTPVIACKGGALPEIIGDAGLLHEIGDVAGLADSMDRIIKDPDLCSDLHAKGRERVQDFTFERMAQATLHVYEEALKKSPAP